MDKIICKNPDGMQVYIVKVIDGRPDWDNVQPFDGVIDITALCKESTESDMSQRLKQYHYDETHNRKANWHKRYF